MSTSLIAHKYREGKVKRTLERELKVLEIVKGEAKVATGKVSKENITSSASLFRDKATP